MKKDNNKNKKELERKKKEKDNKSNDNGSQIVPHMPKPDFHPNNHKSTNTQQESKQQNPKRLKLKKTEGQKQIQSNVNLKHYKEIQKNRGPHR